MTNTTSASFYSATMKPSGKQFNVLPGQSLLDAGLSAGIALPFGCANGSCGECHARCTKGALTKLNNHDYVLTEAQKLDGHCLLCSTTALSDVDIEVYEAISVDDIPTQTLTAKLCRIKQYPNVCEVGFKFTRGKALRFLPGQSVIVTLGNENTLELPIASCPCNAQFVEFHLFKGSKEHDMLMNNANKRITINGPIGSFTLTQATRAPKLFIAQGREFAQLQGMVEQVLNSDLGTPCCLIWQAIDHVTHYKSNLCRSWHDAIDEFHYLPLQVNDGVIDAVSDAWQNELAAAEIYLGRKNAQLTQALTALGANPQTIFYPNQPV